MGEIRVDIIYHFVFKLWSVCLCNCMQHSWWPDNGQRATVLFSENQTNFRGFVQYCTEIILAFLMRFIKFASKRINIYIVFVILNIFGLRYKRVFVREIFQSCVSVKISHFPLTLWPRSAQEDMEFVFLKQRSLISECNLSLLYEFVESENLF